MPKSVNLIERILRHTERMADDECWISDYATNSCGRVFVGEDSYKRQFIHRLAWEAFHAEPLAKDAVLMHTCDVPNCFNPAHLVPGTQKQNVADQISKGRRSQAGGKYHA